MDMDMDMEKVITEIEDALSGNLAKAGHVYRMSLNGLKDKALKDALALLKEQNGLMLALEQSNAVNVFLNAEVERLNELLKEQETVTHYHCNCTYCGKDWWTDDGFPSVCPFCHEKLI